MLLPDNQINTDKLVLQNLTEADAFGPYLSWFSNPKVTQYLSVDPSEVTAGALQGFISQNNNSSIELLLGIFVVPNTHIGNIRLLDIDRDLSRCSIGMLIGEEQHWGKGFASEAIITITNFAHSELGIKRLFAGCHGSNIGSIRSFKKAKYKTLDEVAPDLVAEDNWTGGINIEHLMLVHID